MKILSFAEFASLPDGALFSYFEPMVCRGLYRKGSTLYNEDKTPIDFFEASLEPVCLNGEHPTVDNIESRWALYEDDQQFAVFEDKDIEALKTMLP